ncbi:MAG: hypothetical protein VKJ86_00175 [Synechococcus sp.]|nr:hypothetical protein [Synechococcus sp.]
MTTHFINAEIDLQENPAELPQQIEKELEKRGEEVLRWAITEVEDNKAKVEAIALTSEQ